MRPRKTVTAFARLMEKRLRAKDHRGKRDWEFSSNHYLLGKLMIERDELVIAIMQNKCPRIVAEEAADVANFAMMIADNHIDLMRS